MSNTVTTMTVYVPPPVPKPKGFAIGMFGVEHADDPSQPGAAVTTATLNGYPSSHLNILNLDGFNLVHDYNANWCNRSMVSFLKLVFNNNMKMLVEGKSFYKPDPPPPDTFTAMLPSWVPSWWPSWIKNQFLYVVAVHHPSVSGSNIYDDGGLAVGSMDPDEHIWKLRPNHMSLYQYVYSQPGLKDTIWGHQVSEEAAYFHWQQYTNTFPQSYGDPVQQLYVEVPPVNVYNAISFFRNLIDDYQLAQRLIVMEANHGKSIQDNTVDNEGYYFVPNYLHGPYWSRYDTFFEGSYENFPFNSLSPPYSNIFNNGGHYLGMLKSIDYALLYVPEVHKVIAIYYDNRGGDEDTRRLHVSHLAPNAGWLWFQAYASIVHGATGIWFYWLRETWRPNETKPAANSPDYFEHLPAAYTNFVAPLARELRYLLNQGFIHPGQSVLVHSKTDSPDSMGIVPPPTSYVYPQMSVDPTHMTEQYGIRYAIRKSGPQRIMIAVNPLPVHVTVPFNMAPLGMALSTHVDVIFETPKDTPMTFFNAMYKTTMNGRVTLPSTASSRQINLSTARTFTDTFSPLDVHVYRF